MRIAERVRNFLGFGGGNPTRDYLDHDNDRLREYRRFYRAYRGFYTPAGVNPTWSNAQLARQGRRMRFNFCRPIVNLGAAFLAAGAVKWSVKTEDEALSEAASQAAFDIWDRSGSDREILKSARTCATYGDMVGLAVQGEDRRSRIQFVSPDLCNPTFAGSDVSRLVELQVAWAEEDREGNRVNHFEFYSEGGREVFLNGDRVEEESQEWNGIPAVWIRNLQVLGEPYGISDLDGIVELSEAYDHAMTKREQAIDYHAQPSIVFENTKKTDLEKGAQTMLFLPPGGKAYFLEWQGSPPDVEQHLNRIRNDIAEISQVPAVAFGRQDSGISSISGVALRILYGPLLAKTEDKRANWGPALEYLMWLCLNAEGFEVPLEAVNIQWPDPVPEDALALLEEETGAVTAGLRSKRTAMSNLGEEDPDAELERILEEAQKAQAAVQPLDRREALRRKVQERRQAEEAAETAVP